MDSAALPPAPISDALARRNVLVLVLAQAILGAQLPMIFTIAGLAGQSLASDPCWATLPISATVIGSMLSASPLSALMQRKGRRVGFVIGALMGILGATLGAIALYIHSFPLFVLGALCTGTYMSAQGFFRFAAADGVSEAFRPKAISWVMAGGLLSALIGPQLVKVTASAFVFPFLGSYLAIIALNTVGIFIFAALKTPMPAQPTVTQALPPSRSRLELLKTPQIAVAVLCATVSYALMNLVMTSSPLAVVGCGFDTSDAADVVSLHVIAMYLPSFFTGHLIARFGAHKIIAAGLVILGFAAAVAMTGVELEKFFITMILLGIGWNFGFIGATNMLTGTYAPHERGRMQGLNDMIVFGGVTLASLTSGQLMNCAGGSAQAGWESVNLAMVPFLILAGGALIWLSATIRNEKA